MSVHHANQNQPIVPQNYKCPCGKTLIVANELRHYMRIILACGNVVWALQPRRGGPLVLYPWPGPNLTREQMGGRPSAETIVRRMNTSHPSY